jgi:hypothetical protein
MLNCFLCHASVCRKYLIIAHYRPSSISQEAINACSNAISDLTHSRPVLRPATTDAIRLTPEAIRKLAFIVQTFHAKLQHRIREKGALSMSSLIEECGKERSDMLLKLKALPHFS